VYTGKAYAKSLYKLLMTGWLELIERKLLQKQTLKMNVKELPLWQPGLLSGR
jgi:hypothetical protein